MPDPAGMFKLAHLCGAKEGKLFLCNAPSQLYKYFCPCLVDIFQWHRMGSFLEKLVLIQLPADHCRVFIQSLM